MKHRIRVIQVYRLEREAVIEVEATSAFEAAELVGLGEVDLPPYRDPVWKESRSLENEETHPA